MQLINALNGIDIGDLDLPLDVKLYHIGFKQGSYILKYVPDLIIYFGNISVWQPPVHFHLGEVKLVYDKSNQNNNKKKKNDIHGLVHIIKNIKPTKQNWQNKQWKFTANLIFVDDNSVRGAPLWRW